MSMWIDQKYIGILSGRLDKFTRKDSYTYNFRCPICGDSQKNKNKARGYLFGKKGGLFYRCHNCQASMSLGSLIRVIDSNLYKEYCLERYASGETGFKAHKSHGFVFTPVSFKSNKEDNAFNNLLTPLDKLNEDHEVIRYLTYRKIPKDRYSDLRYVDDISKFKKFAEGYDEKIVTNESRLVIPFFDENNELVGLSGRALGDEKIRYVTIRIKKDSPMIFGLNNVDKDQTIYVTEGPIDSLFLPNSVAVGNSNLKSVGEHLSKDNLVLVYDNEPRNKEIVREMESSIKQGFSICIWPETIVAKDINEMIQHENLSTDEILATINKNTFSGPTAIMNLLLWRRC